MSEYLMPEVSDTPVVTIEWCPTCQPDRDPIREPLLEIRFCPIHYPSTRGEVDNEVRFDSPGRGIDQVTGDGGNRAICDFIHRRKSKA